METVLPREDVETSRTLLDTVIPEKQFADAIAVDVKAPPEVILAAFRDVTVEEMPLAEILGRIRYLPGKLLGHPQPEAEKGRSFWKGIEEAGWVTLAEDPGREVVFGGAGKYHQIVDQEPVVFRASGDFFSFSDPAYQKLAIAVRVEPGEAPGHHRLVLEHRTQPLSEASARKFRRYWFVIQPMGAFVTRQLLMAVKRRAEREAQQ